MSTDQTPHTSDLTQLIDEQLELAAAKLPVLPSSALHPSPADHDERTSAHPSIEDVLLGNAQATPEMIDDLRLPQGLPALSDDELARQALAVGETDLKPLAPLA